MTPEMMLSKMLSTPQVEAVVEKTASAEEIETSAMEKLAWADEFGKELAREHMEKSAFLAGANNLLQRGLTAAKPMAGKAVNKVMSTGSGARAAIGAGVGAVGGAIKNPGYDSQGNKKSRLGNMAIGAGLGGASGAALKPAMKRIGDSKGAVGRYVRDASYSQLPPPKLLGQFNM